MSTRRGKSSSGSAPKSKAKPEARAPLAVIPLKLVEHYMEDMAKMQERPDDYTASDRSEIIERVGLAQFYYGNYHDAIATFSQSLKVREDKKYGRNNARMQVLRGIGKYRTGDLSGAESDFKDVNFIG